MIVDSFYQVFYDFYSNGVDFFNFIIDDGWQLVIKGYVFGWKIFEVDRGLFLDGLKVMILKFCVDFLEIVYIVVWYVIYGYWGGISVDGEIV